MPAGCKRRTRNIQEKQQTGNQFRNNNINDRCVLLSSAVTWTYIQQPRLTSSLLFFSHPLISIRWAFSLESPDLIYLMRLKRYLLAVSCGCLTNLEKEWPRQLKNLSFLLLWPSWHRIPFHLVLVSAVSSAFSATHSTHLAQNWYTTQQPSVWGTIQFKWSL